MTTKTHNGWTNYETWAVALWLNNDQGTQEHWRERAREIAEHAEPSTVWTKAESARYELADALKDEIEEDAPGAVCGTLYGDLVKAALDEVNWSEIAKSFLAERN